MRIRRVHVVALLGVDHLQGQLVVVAQEQAPLAALGDVRRLPHDVEHRVAILETEAHEQTRHEREVERHVALVALAEVGAHILRPLVGLRQDHAVGVAGVDLLPQLLDDPMRLGEVLAVGAVALDQVGNGVQTKRIHAHVEPEAHDVDDLAHDVGVVEIEIGLVREEAVPEVGLGHRIPGPVRLFGIGEDDARVPVLLVRVAPHVVLPLFRAG